MALCLAFQSVAEPWLESVDIREKAGRVAGVAHSLDGETLWVVHRGPRIWDGRTYSPDSERLSDAVLKEGALAAPTVVQLDKETGRVLQSWGAGLLYLPHSVVSDQDGNVWVTDTGLHQVRVPPTCMQAEDHARPCSQLHCVSA